MAKDHVTALLDAYLTMDADGIGARVAAEVSARLADVPGDFKVCLIVLDDLVGPFDWIVKAGNSACPKTVTGQIAENDREDAVTVKPDSRQRTPEAQLRSFIDRFDPNDQKLIRSVRAAVRKRFPTANELAYDYNNSIVISYSPTDRGIDGIVAISARATGVHCTSIRDLGCPTRRSFCWDRESRLASSGWTRPASWRIQT